MSHHEPVELLVNVHSRRGRTAYKTVVQACEDAGLQLDHIHKIDNTDALPAVLQAISTRKPKLLIVASGDGTVSEVVDYLAGSTIELGFIPLGTTNNFARSLGLPLSITEAVARIASGNIKAIDLGVLGEDYFANVAGMGISARIAQSVTPTAKRRYGRWAYALFGLKALLGHKPFQVEVADKDGELRLHFETHQVIIANGRFHAGKVIAQGTALDSRELVIFKLGGASRLNFLWHMIDYYVGKRRSVSHSAYLIAKDVRITTSTPQPIELDGEVKASSPARVRVMPKAVRVRC